MIPLRRSLKDCHTQRNLMYKTREYELVSGGWVFNSYTVKAVQDK